MKKILVAGAGHGGLSAAGGSRDDELTPTAGNGLLLLFCQPDFLLISHGCRLLPAAVLPLPAGHGLRHCP